MRGTVKWFNDKSGYGFITGEDGKDVFFHFSSIHMKGHKSLDADDMVEFVLGAGKDGREQALKVHPILTLQMIKKALAKENCYVEKIRTSSDKGYFVMGADNAVKSPEQGMTFEELAAYAGFSVSEE